MEDIEQLMDETQEAVEKQREINELISGQLTQVSCTFFSKYFWGFQMNYRTYSVLFRLEPICA